MKNRFFNCLLLCLSLCLNTALAHEVHHTMSTGNAIVVQLKYADGKPFAYEAFEATPKGANVPAQVGRTDAQGRAVFIPDNTPHWTLKAYSADGHGVSLDLDTPITLSATVAPSDNGPSRLTLMLFGLSVIFFCFALYQLWIKRKKP